MTAQRDAAIASIIAEAIRSAATIDWDKVRPDALAIMMDGHVGRLSTTASTREHLVHIAAVALNGILAFDRKQGAPRGAAPTTAAPPRPDAPPMQSFDRGAWGSPLPPTKPAPAAERPERWWDRD